MKGFDWLRAICSAICNPSIRIDISQRWLNQNCCTPWSQAQNLQDYIYYVKLLFIPVFALQVTNTKFPVSVLLPFLLPLLEQFGPHLPINLHSILTTSPNGKQETHKLGIIFHNNRLNTFFTIRTPSSNGKRETQKLGMIIIIITSSYVAHFTIIVLMRSIYQCPGHIKKVVVKDFS